MFFCSRTSLTVYLISNVKNDDHSTLSTQQLFVLFLSFFSSNLSAHLLVITHGHRKYGVFPIVCASFINNKNIGFQTKLCLPWTLLPKRRCRLRRALVPGRPLLGGI